MHPASSSWSRMRFEVEVWTRALHLLRVEALKAEPVDCFDTVADDVAGEDPPLLLL